VARRLANLEALLPSGPVRRALAAVVIVLLASVAASSAEGGRKPRVTFIGDSVAASFEYVPAAKARLSRGLDVRYDLRVCRRLVDASCAYQGYQPQTTLETVRSRAGSLGRVVIIDVGYNDTPSRFASQMALVMRELKADGVRKVIWVTLREERSLYAVTNRAIRAAPRRWPKVAVVADWERYSHGQAWFGGDGLHLNGSGAVGLATLLRPVVLRSVRQAVG
jgi:hypothetical protein